MQLHFLSFQTTLNVILNLTLNTTLKNMYVTTFFHQKMLPTSSTPELFRGAFMQPHTQNNSVLSLFPNPNNCNPNPFASFVSTFILVYREMAPVRFFFWYFFDEFLWYFFD